jgi:hypothetical protein
MHQNLIRCDSFHIADIIIQILEYVIIIEENSNFEYYTYKYHSKTVQSHCGALMEGIWILLKTSSTILRFIG